MDGERSTNRPHGGHVLIIQDTREQAPLKFKKDSVLTDVVTETLSVGDYAVRYTNGLSCPIVFERKSLPDLYGTMTGGYPRFKKELMRAKQAGIELVLIIEGSLTEVQAGVKYSKWDGDSMIKKLFTLLVRYGLYPVFCSDRLEMASFIKAFYEAWGRNMTVKQKVREL